MLIRPFKSLPIRTGIAIAVSALILTILFTLYIYNQYVEDNIKETDITLSQLVSTVEKTAAIAAYLDNKELGKDVTEGLLKNDIVEGARLSNDKTIIVTRGEFSRSNPKMYKYDLESPFIEGAIVGSIELATNRSLILTKARYAARKHAISLITQSLLLVIVVIFLVNHLLTRPLLKMAKSLHAIEYGDNTSIECPKGHNDNEIGLLVKDTNHLLQSVYLSLEKERNLRAYTESVERQFRQIFEHASSGILLTDHNGKLLLFNPALQEILNIQQETSYCLSDFFIDKALVKNILTQITTENSAPVALDLLQKPTKDKAEERWLHVLFSSVKDENDNTLIECIIYDISERINMEKQTRFEAEHDALTKLYNRRAGEKTIQQGIIKARQEHSNFALMLIDLDRFKPINDTYGHEAGDKVLVEIASRLKNTLRFEDTVIRWGGDEFLVVLHHLHSSNDLAAVADKILTAFQPAIELGNQQQDTVGASIGITMYSNTTDMEEMIEQADQAMYQVKQSGRNGYAFYQDLPKNKT